MVCGASSSEICRTVDTSHICLPPLTAYCIMNRITYRSPIFVSFHSESVSARKRSLLYILRTRALSCHRQCALRPPWLSLILHLHKSARSPLSPGTHLTHYANFYTAIDTIEQPVPLPMAETLFECLQKILPQSHERD